MLQSLLIASMNDCSSRVLKIERSFVEAHFWGKLSVSGRHEQGQPKRAVAATTTTTYSFPTLLKHGRETLTNPFAQHHHGSCMILNYHVHLVILLDGLEGLLLE